MKKLAKSKLFEVWSIIAKEHELFVPVEQEGESVNFSLWQEGEHVNLDHLKTNVSPKQIVFPQTETYLKFKTTGKKLSLENVGGKQAPYVLFGVRPCDAQSFALIDNVFLTEPVDRFYEERRNKGILVSLACSNPEETCFCQAFGITPGEAPQGVDVATWDMGTFLLWKPQTAKGESLTNQLNGVLEEALAQDEQDCQELQQDIQQKLKDLPLAKIDPKQITGDLKEIFDAKIWDEYSSRCLGCGSCTYVCPTCHCYDIRDFDGGKAGERFRCWDSCMFSEFTLMAHGNPRKTQKEKFRQRFMHKLVYYPNNNEGVYACVGCGRCMDKCPVNMNIVKVIKKLGGEKA
ncbi:ferredoxin [Sporomusaceae bacterium BoRhaA]|uniref:4Fe-4S dicluster domain-containing protein n=1 Tax=Pelorhabdus rhamnosifermentans TaxID=2772457 RepID=UPI001C060F24|nr:4Fe-4S dicluster domain-containing protein [Pelorhabdus rhamnosifermentans]MBU2703853.1 ferredoxin [Pelorhabdus rhamnosifermentans]